MRNDPTPGTLILVCAALLLAACREPTSSQTESSEAKASVEAAGPTGLGPLSLVEEPFLKRAPIDPYFINQAPDFMIRSKERTDIVFQRLVSPNPGFGAWHVHPGPSFGYVDQGVIRITRVTRDGCVTAEYGAGATYYEIADEVHRVEVVVPAVEYKVRFNTPVGGAFTSNLSEAPTC